MAITFCTNTARTDGYQQYVQRDLRQVTEAMTPDQLVDLLRQKAPYNPCESYLTYDGFGKTFLGHAATHAPQLINPIFRLGRKYRIINLGNANGETPLHQIVTADIPNERKLLSAKRLIELGANVNLASIEGSTPLLAALKAENIALAKLFLANGAATVIPEELFAGMPPRVLPIWRARMQWPPERLAQAQREIEEETRATIPRLSNALAEQPALHSMPTDICTIAAGYAAEHPMTQRRVALPPLAKTHTQYCPVQ